MRPIHLTIAAAALAATPAFAGDPAAGERMWRQCMACHMIAAPDGEVIQRGQPTGPNLYGVVGRQAGTYPGFEGKYSSYLVEAGEMGLVWDEESFAGYVANPTTFLRDFIGDDKASGNMGFRLRSGAEDMFAYLATFSEAEAEDEE